MRGRWANVARHLLPLTLVLALPLVACGTPPRPPRTTISEDEFVIRPVFATKDQVPSELADKYAPAILVDTDDPRMEELLRIISQDKDCEKTLDYLDKGYACSPTNREEFIQILTATLTTSDAYIWFQPEGSDELLPGYWTELTYEAENRELFLKWFVASESQILVQYGTLE